MGNDAAISRGRMTIASLNRGSQLTVLTEINSLTDAVLDHILSDTAKTLNMLPAKASSSSTETAVKDAESMEHGARSNVQAVAQAQVEDLANTAVHEAWGELQKLEHTLAWRYTPGCSMGTERHPARPLDCKDVNKLPLMSSALEVAQLKRSPRREQPELRPLI